MNAVPVISGYYNLREPGSYFVRLAQQEPLPVWYKFEAGANMHYGYAITEWRASGNPILIGWRIAHKLPIGVFQMILNLISNEKKCCNDSVKQSP